MPFPTTEAAADHTDPTSQIPWPTGRKPIDPEYFEGPRPAVFDHTYSAQGPTQWKHDDSHTVSLEQPAKAPRTQFLTKWDLFNLSIGMAGAQVAWTVELGYGTPFLLSLGLSEEFTSLVWLAGPISGLIAQPLIGAVSDSSTSHYRRRFWISWSTVVLVASCLVLAYAEGIAGVLADFFGAGVGDWDPQRRKEAKNVAIGIAITAFYLLDFALNALQASLRNLLLDIAPPEQMSAGNAWHGRMTHAGNIIGFGLGFLDLAGWPVLRALGGSQFRKFCVVGIILIVVTVFITCWTQEEHPLKDGSRKKNGFREVLGTIYTALLNLPSPVRKICFVQVFAFMAWFPFLFYATTYIGQVMALQNNKDPDVDIATRAGNFALLLYSIVAVLAGSLLPELTRRDERLLETVEGENEEAEFDRIHATVSAWNVEATTQGKGLKLPRMPITLRDMWSFALALYGIISICTFFIKSVAQATFAVAMIGICWAVAVWAPFAMIMEFLKEAEESATDSLFVSRATGPRMEPPASSSEQSRGAPTEHTLLLQNDSEHYEAERDMPAPCALSQAKPIAGGTVLGIHNLAIVFPQFIVALVASMIFRIVDETPAVIEDPSNIYLGKNGVAWVLRFGGLSAFVGAVLARMIPPTLQERRMHRRLAQMKAVRRSM